MIEIYHQVRLCKCNKAIEVDFPFVGLNNIYGGKNVIIGLYEDGSALISVYSTHETIGQTPHIVEIEDPIIDVQIWEEKKQTYMMYLTSTNHLFIHDLNDRRYEMKNCTRNPKALTKGRFPGFIDSDGHANVIFFKPNQIRSVVINEVDNVIDFDYMYNNIVLLTADGKLYYGQFDSNGDFPKKYHQINCGINNYRIIQMVANIDLYCLDIEGHLHFVSYSLGQDKFAFSEKEYSFPHTEYKSIGRFTFGVGFLNYDGDILNSNGKVVLHTDAKFCDNYVYTTDHFIRQKTELITEKLDHDIPKQIEYIHYSDGTYIDTRDIKQIWSGHEYTFAFYKNDPDLRIIHMTAGYDNHLVGKGALYRQLPTINIDKHIKDMSSLRNGTLLFLTDDNEMYMYRNSASMRKFEQVKIEGTPVFLFPYDSAYLDDKGSLYIIKENKSLIKISLDEPIIDFTRSLHEIFVLTKSGKVYSDSYSNEINDYHFKGKIEYSLEGKTIVQLSGHSHFLALDENGKVYAKGRNDRGQLGNGHKTHGNVNVLKKPFTQVLGLEGKKIVQIAGGRFSSLFITKENDLYYCGEPLDYWKKDGIYEVSIPAFSGIKNVSYVADSINEKDIFIATNGYTQKINLYQ